MSCERLRSAYPLELAGGDDSRPATEWPTTRSERAVNQHRAALERCTNGMTGPFVITLYVSHHIAGPLFAIRRYLESVSRGDLDFEPKLRGGDQTTPLALSLAHALESLNARLVAIRTAADAVRAGSEQISRHLEAAPEPSDACRKDCAVLLERIEGLHREIDFFRLRRGPDRA